MDSPDFVSNYYILLLVGIAAIGFHAYGLFSQRVVDPSRSTLHSDLNLLPVISIAGRKDFSKGYLIYLISFEAVYIVLASSTTLLSFVLNLASREDTVGALSSQMEPNAAIPVLASTALILLSQIKPFSRFENYIRDMAHGVSGVPTNARDVKDNISAALARKIRQLDEGVSEAVSSEEFTLLTDCRDKARALSRKLVEDGVDATRAKTVYRSYCNVLYLHEVTLGYTGISEWHREETTDVIEMFRSIDYEVDAMEALIRDYSDSPAMTAVPAEDDISKETAASAEQTGESAGWKEVPLVGEQLRTGKRWNSVTEQCIKLEQRLLLLLALLFINRPDAELEGNTLLKDIMQESVRTREQRLGNVVFSSVIAGLMLSLLILPFYKYGVDQSKSWIRESPYENKLPFANPAGSNRFSGSLTLGEVLANGMSASELSRANRQWQTAANKIGNRIRFWAYEIVKPALIFLVAAGVTLAYRNRAAAERRWKPRLIPGDDNVPLLRYLTAGLYAYVATLGAMFLYHFLVLALIPAIRSQNDFMTYEGMEVLYSAIPEILYASLISFVISYFVCDYTDFSRWKNDARHAYRSLRKRRILVAALMCGGLNWVVKTSLGKVNAGWDVLDFFAVPFLSYWLFLMSFAWFLWRYENDHLDRLRRQSHMQQFSQYLVGLLARDRLAGEGGQDGIGDEKANEEVDPGTGRAAKRTTGQANANNRSREPI